MWELWTCHSNCIHHAAGGVTGSQSPQLAVEKVFQIVATWRSALFFQHHNWVIKVFDLWDRQTSECFSVNSWMNLLRYEAIPASGISLVKELLFLLFILVKTQPSMSFNKLSVAHIHDWKLCEHNQSHNRNFCLARCCGGNTDLCQLLCVCQIIHSDGQEDVQQCVCHDRG